MVRTYVFDIDAKYWCLDVEWWSGMEDWSGFMDKIDEVVPMDQQPELLQKLTKGNFTLCIMYEQFAGTFKTWDPSARYRCKWLDKLYIVLHYLFWRRLCQSNWEMLAMSNWKRWDVQVMSMVPGFSQELMPKGRENDTKIKKFMTKTDSMTNEGLSLCPLLYWFFWWWSIDGLGSSDMIVGGEVQYPGGSTHLAWNSFFVVCSCLSLLVQFVAAHILFAFGLQN